MLNRRQFLRLGTGTAVTAVLYGCTDSKPASTPASAAVETSTTATSNTAPSTTAAPAGTAATTTTTTDPVVSGSLSRTLVVVQLNGGNDALNTLVPIDGRYHDARPMLGLADADLVRLTGTDAWGLHQSLEPLLDAWNAGNATFLPGIGFADPDRSHFVSMDRWWRADDLSSATGWLGRATSGDTPSLYATALGSGAPLLRSDLYQPAVVLDASTFQFSDLLPGAALASLSTPVSTDPLTALAQRSLQSAVDAVAAFGSITGSEPDDDLSGREGGFTLVEGLDLAARIVTEPALGARIVVVSVGGFDTHSNQLVTHTDLLTDLAAGISSFLTTVAAAGVADRTMLVTTSEFGRRIGENASGGFDHGAGGLSMMFGPMVNGGVLSSIDLGDQLDGDVRPTLDPRVMYTACLDWLGQDATLVLGRRYDEVRLLR